jgi:hypothetical protein
VHAGWEVQERQFSIADEHAKHWVLLRYWVALQVQLIGETKVKVDWQERQFVAEVHVLQKGTADQQSTQELRALLRYWLAVQTVQVEPLPPVEQSVQKVPLLQLRQLGIMLQGKHLFPLK